MKEVTAEQVKQAADERNIGYWKLRECSMCFTPIGYVIDGDGPAFDSNCGCVSYHTPPEPCGWDKLADTFNMQKPEIRERMWGDFLASGVPNR